MVTRERFIANAALFGSRIDINVSTNDEASQVETTDGGFSLHVSGILTVSISKRKSSRMKKEKAGQLWKPLPRKKMLKHGNLAYNTG